MRILTAILLVTMLPACTSILLGDTSTTETGVVTDERSSSEVAADNAISAAIRQKLGADPAVRRYAIGISTLDGHVTLSGTVGSFAARDSAVRIASGTEGVRSVRNRLVVNTNY